MYSITKNSNHEKGQGLVEYAIILAVVGIVVVGVMTALGPKVGDTFSTIHASLPGDAAIADDGGGGEEPGPWISAAREHGSFTLPLGTYEVQYGANGTYVTRMFTGPATIGCNNATFGDPLYGVVKSCSYR